jgi:WD40 repeat protein/ankyrin repeat protein
MSRLSIDEAGQVVSALEDLTIDASKAIGSAAIQEAFTSAGKAVVTCIGHAVCVVPGVGDVVSLLFQAFYGVYKTAIEAKHNKANCKIAGDRCRSLAIVISNCAREYANSGGEQYVANLKALINHIERLKGMVEKYSKFSKVRQFFESNSFHIEYEHINADISDVMQMINADLGALSVHQNKEILDAMRFNEVLEIMNVLQQKTDLFEENRAEMEKTLTERLNEDARHLKIQFKELELLMEKHQILREEKAETSARILQKDMVRVMNLITAAGKREHENSKMLIAGQNWIKNILRQRNSEDEAQRLIDSAMLLNEIDQDRVQFHDKKKLLAHCSYGEVYLAEFGGDPCAAKVIRTAKMTVREQTQLYESFQKEFATMCAVRHPRVIRVYGAVVEIPEQLVLVMEHAKKGSLRALLDERKGGFWGDAAHDLTSQIALGMEVLYMKGIHHRNLNTGNVLLDEHSHVKICDFGLSKAEALQTHISTMGADYSGSLAWMSPERLRGETKDDEKCDVYSFAITIWEILTGGIPWKDMSKDQITEQVVKNGNRPEIDKRVLTETVKAWRVEGGEEVTTLDGHWAVNSVTFSPDGARIVSGSYDGTVKVWNVGSGECMKTLTGHSSSVNSVSFSPDGARIVSGSNDNTAKVWSIESGECVTTLAGHSHLVECVSFSPDGSRIVSGSNDNTAKVWNAESGECVTTLAGHSSSVYSVSFSPDGASIVSGSLDKTVKVWRVESGECVTTLAVQPGVVTSVSFSPDGASIVSGSYDGTVKVWSVESGECVTTLTGHSSRVMDLSFSPDGASILSGSYDGTAKLWSLESGKCVTPLDVKPNVVTSVSFSPDGAPIVSGSTMDEVSLSIVDLMKMCYDEDPAERPTFSEVVLRTNRHRKSSLEDELGRREEMKREEEREEEINKRVNRRVSDMKDDIEAEVRKEIATKEAAEKQRREEMERVKEKFRGRKDPLIISAALHGSTDDVEALLEGEETDVNAQGAQNSTALHVASSTGRVDVVKRLLEQKAIEVNRRDMHGKTPLHYAAGGGHCTTVELLLGSESIDAGVTDNDSRTALHYAAEAGFAKVVKLLLTREKIDPSARALDGTTPVSFAVVNVNAKDNEKRTALYHATLHNRDDVVELLLGAQTINVNAKAKYGYSPLTCAVMKGHCKVLKSLLKHPNIDVNPLANNEETLLHFASKHGFEEVVRILVSQPWTDVNAANRYGTTPLHNASKDGHEGVVRLLLAKKSIEVNAKDKSGNTPLFYALQKSKRRGSKRYEGIIALLREENGGQ